MSKADIKQMIGEIDKLIQETEESFAGTRGVLQDCMKLVLPMLKDQQKVLTAIALELGHQDSEMRSRTDPRLMPGHREPNDPGR